jgi:hypothetical protein
MRVLETVNACVAHSSARSAYLRRPCAGKRARAYSTVTTARLFEDRDTKVPFP